MASSFDKLFLHTSRDSWIGAEDFLATGTCRTGTLAEFWGASDRTVCPARTPQAGFGQKQYPRRHRRSESLLGITTGAQRCAHDHLREKSMKMFKLLPAMAAASVLVVALSGCGGTQPAPAAAEASKPTDVSLYYSAPITQQSLGTIAKEHNLFPSSVNVDVKGGDSTVGMTLVSSGRVQVYINASPTPEQVVSGGAQVKWAGTWQEGIDTVFLGRGGVETLQDMKGKRFGIIQKGLTLSVMGNEALRRAGLTAADYTSVPLGTLPAVNAAFAAGTVDGIVTDPASAAELLKKVDGSKSLFDFYGNIPWNGAGVALNTEWAAKNPAAASAVLEGLNAALQLIHEDPAKVTPTIGKLTGLSGAALDASVARFTEHSAKEIKPLTIETEKEIMQILNNDGEAWATSTFAEGMISDPKYLADALQKK